MSEERAPVRAMDVNIDWKQLFAIRCDVLDDVLDVTMSFFVWNTFSTAFMSASSLSESTTAGCTVSDKSYATSTGSPLLSLDGRNRSPWLARDRVCHFDEMDERHLVPVRPVRGVIHTALWKALVSCNELDGKMRKCMHRDSPLTLSWKACHTAGASMSGPIFEIPPDDLFRILRVVLHRSCAFRRHIESAALRTVSVDFVDSHYMHSSLHHIYLIWCCTSRVRVGSYVVTWPMVVGLVFDCYVSLTPGKRHAGAP